MQRSNYPPSYYAATIEEPQGYPQLQSQVRCDVAIIGGGFSGIATALMLAERNVDVVVLEAFRVGWGASGRNGGQLVGGFDNNDRVRSRLAPEARHLVDTLCYRPREIIAGWIKKYKILCDFQQGQMVVAVKPSHCKALQEEFVKHQQEGRGDHVTYHDQDSLRQCLDSPLYFAGLENRLDGSLHPLNLVLGEARAAASKGAKIFEDSQVRSWTSGRKHCLETDHGVVYADRLVLAGNAYHQFNRGGLARTVIPAMSFVGVSETMNPKEIKRVFGRSLAIYDTNNIIDYFRVTKDHRLLFGAGCHYSDGAIPPLEPLIKRRVRRVFPQWSDLRLEYTWHGHIGIVLNRIPMIGRLDDKTYYLQGYSGHGLGLSHMYGELVAESLCGEQSRFLQFSRIRHLKIPWSRRLSNIALALGMQYYKLRDVLP